MLCFCECSKSRLRKEVLNCSEPFPGCSQCRLNWGLSYQRLRQKSTHFLPVKAAKLTLLWYLNKVSAIVKMGQESVESYGSFGGVSVPARVYLLLSLHLLQVHLSQQPSQLLEHSILLPLFSLPIFTPHSYVPLLLCKRPLQHPSSSYNSFFAHLPTWNSTLPSPQSLFSGSLWAESCRDGATLLQQSQPPALSMWEAKKQLFCLCLNLTLVIYCFGASVYCITKRSVLFCSMSFWALNYTAFGVPHLNNSQLWENLCAYSEEDILTKIFTGWIVCSKMCKVLFPEFRKSMTSDVTTGCFFFDLKEVSCSAKIRPNVS